MFETVQKRIESKMHRNFWCILCSLFLAYNLKVLFEDFYSVNYHLVEEGDELYDETTNIVACTHSNWIGGGNRMNASEVKREMVDARSFLNASIVMIESHLRVQNLFRLDESYIFRGFLCFLLNRTAYETDPSVKCFLRLYRVQLFAYSPGKRPFFFEYVYNNYRNNHSLRIHKQKVYGPRYLASSNCRTIRDQFLASKMNCLRKCTFNAPADFHLPISRQQFDLSDFRIQKYDPSRSAEYHSKRNVTAEDPIETVNNHSAEKESDNETFRKCVRRCPRDDCFSETYNSITFGNKLTEIKIQSAIYRAYYSTPHFWLQLFGLLTLFTGTSVVSALPHLMSLTTKKLKGRDRVYFVRYFPKIKPCLVVFSSIFVLVQSILMITDYYFEKHFPNRTIIWNFSSEPFSVIICLPIETLIHNEIETGRKSLILADLPFDELEKKTRSFENCVKKIKLLHGNRMKNLNWTLTEKVLFKNSSFNQMKYLSRCFRIELDFEDLKYRKMMPFYYLTIRFNTQFREVYLIERRQSFSSGLVDFKGDYFVQKTTEKTMPASRKANCGKEDRKKQIDKCINQQFVKEHSALPLNSVVDKDDFGDEINRLKFSEANITSIEQTCVETYRDRKSCEEVYFKESLKRMSSYCKTSIRLNLNYEDSISSQIDQSSIKLVLAILNVESIFFKNNIASCLIFLLAVLKRTFKLNWSSNKLDRFLVLSICLAGFMTHNVFVFKGIIEDELAQNGYFQMMRQFTLPNTVFCFDLSKFELDENHKITGNYLNRLTEELRLGNIVEKVMYFNRTHDKVFRPPNNLSSYSDSEITIRPFYLLAFHCLEFQLNVKLDESDFYLLVNKFILRIYFKHSFTNQTNRTYLFYRQPGQKQVSDMLEYKIGPDRSRHRPIYEIVLERIEVDKVDHFENLKDLQRLFFGKRRTSNVNEYLNEMQAKFGDLENLTTNEIPLEQGDLSKEIDNELFKQFYIQVMNVTDHQQPISLESNLVFFNFYSKRIDLDLFTFFQFTILPISKRVEISNNENFAKLIQDILISLSLWLNISIADLLVHLNLLLGVPLRVYFLLVKVRTKLVSLRKKPIHRGELEIELEIGLEI